MFTSRVLAWLLTTLFLAGGAAAVGAALHVWTGYRPVARVEVAPDGVARRTPELRSNDRYESFVVVSGGLRGRYSGVTYDALRAYGPDGSTWGHNLLELSPETLRVSAAGDAQRQVFVPRPAADVDGQPVVARVEPQALADDMRLPEEARRAALDGTLWLEVWERDTRQQGAAAAALATAGLLLLGGGLLRVRRHLRLGRSLPQPRAGSNAWRHLRRIQRRRREALRALGRCPLRTAGLVERVESLYHTARDLAAALDACERAAAVEQAGGAAESARGRAGEHVARLNAIEAALAELPARLPLALSPTAEDPERLLHGLEQELEGLRETARVLRALQE